MVHCYLLFPNLGKILNCVLTQPRVIQTDIVLYPTLLINCSHLIWLVLQSQSAVNIWLKYFSVEWLYDNESWIQTKIYLKRRVESKETCALNGCVNRVLNRTFPLEIATDKHKSLKGHLGHFSVLHCWGLWEMLRPSTKAGIVLRQWTELPQRGPGGPEWTVELRALKEGTQSHREVGLLSYQMLHPNDYLQRPSEESWESMGVCTGISIEESALACSSSWIAFVGNGKARAKAPISWPCFCVLGAGLSLLIFTFLLREDEVDEQQEEWIWLFCCWKNAWYWTKQKKISWFK